MSSTTIRISAIDQTREAFQSVQRNVGGLQNSLKGMAGPLAAAFSVAAVGAFSKSLIDAADNMAKLSQKTGISVTELSRFTNAGNEAGVSQDTLASSLIRLNKSIADGVSGNQQIQEAFRQVGISLNDLKRLSPEEIFLRLSDGMAKAADGPGKIQVGNALLGKSFSELIPMLNQGSEGIKAYQATFDEDFAKKAEVFNDNITKMTENFKRLMVNGISPVIAGINKLFELYDEGAKRKPLAGTFDPFSDPTGTGDDFAVRMESAREVVAKTSQAMQKEAKKTSIGLKQETLDFVTFNEAVAKKIEEFDYDNLRKEWDRVTEGIKLAGISIDDIGRNAMINLEDSIIDLINGTTSLQDSFKKMATSIINDLLRMYIRYMIVKPLFDALFGAPSGPAAPIVQSSPGVPTGRAIGGPVSAGKPFVVGERGAELFVPNSSGSIVPNHKMGGETNNIVVNVNMENGSVNATDANRLGVLVGNVVKAELVKQSRPGGLLAA
jgi:DNA-binding Xre family transcriptional regulator